MSPDTAQATSLLEGLCRGEPNAGAQLAPMLYEQLRKVASGLLRRERDDHTLQPTALVHEAWISLIDHDGLAGVSTEEGRRQFMGLAATAMRHVLIDHARSKGRQKRGGDLHRVTFSPDLSIAAVDAATLIDLHEAIDALSERSARLAKLAELRLFAGLSTREAAEVLGVSRSVAIDDWAMARAILSRALDASSGEAGSEKLETP